MRNKRRMLREMLYDRKKPILVSGAHDAISAKLAEQVGFNAVWSSGFGISLAQKGVPDANLMTMTELLEFARNMDDAVNIPVVADCDNGFGNAINVMRTVTEFEKAGIAGISIEDNIFPKRCSFYESVERELVSIEEFVNKIKAAKSVQMTEDFVLIARTEAFIAGYGLDEALERANAYASAGADAILVHSKENNFNELKQFSKYWDRETPLVVVPTKFPQTTVQEMFLSGFKVIIYANQAVRSAVEAMRETLLKIIREQNAQCVNHQIASLEEVFKLINLEELERMENLFLKQ